MITLCSTPRGGTRDEATEVISRLTTCLHLFLVLYGPIQAPPFLKMSANTSQLVNSELSDEFDLGRREYDQRGAFMWSLPVNTVNTPYLKALLLLTNGSALSVSV